MQVTWSRGLLSEKSLQVLSIGDFTHINDKRFLIAKKPQDNVSYIEDQKKCESILIIVATSFIS